MLEVVAHVVTTERQHRKGIETKLASAAQGSGGHLGCHRRAHEHAMLPVQRLVDQGNDSLAATAKQERRNRNALGSFPLWGDHGALGGRSRETGIGMSSLRALAGARG